MKLFSNLSEYNEIVAAGERDSYNSVLVMNTLYLTASLEDAYGEKLGVFVVFEITAGERESLAKYQKICVIQEECVRNFVGS